MKTNGFPPQPSVFWQRARVCQSFTCEFRQIVGCFHLAYFLPCSAFPFATRAASSASASSKSQHARRSTSLFESFGTEAHNVFTLAWLKTRRTTESVKAGGNKRCGWFIGLKCERSPLWKQCATVNLRTEPYLRKRPCRGCPSSLIIGGFTFFK